MDNTTTVTFYKDGFFGYSENDFQFGSIWHFLPIILMIICIILIYKYRKQIRNYKYETSVRYILAFVMLFVEMSFFWRLSYVGTQGAADNMLGYLPLQMCQWGLIISVFTLISKNKKMFSINFFITLLFATVAIIYPLVITNAGPTFYRYYQFWLEHTLPIISVFYLMFVHEVKLEYKGIYRTLAFIIPLAIICIIVNENIPNANYLYLKLDVPFLPENQIQRAIILTIIVTLIFNLMYFIYYKINKLVSSRKKTNKKYN